MKHIYKPTVIALLALFLGCTSEEIDRVKAPFEGVNNFVETLRIKKGSTSELEDEEVREIHTYNFTKKGLLSRYSYEAPSANGDYLFVDKLIKKEDDLTKLLYEGSDVWVKTKLMTSQYGVKQPLTETFYWTYQQESIYIRMYSEYVVIDGKEYLKSLVEKRVNEAKEFVEHYRLDFDYSQFNAGVLRVTQRLLGEVVGVNSYLIEFYDNSQLPDSFLVNGLYPLSCHKAFLYSGLMGTWDYYVVECHSDLDKTDSSMLYELTKDGLPKRVKQITRHREFDYMNEISYYNFEYVER